MVNNRLYAVEWKGRRRYGVWNLHGMPAIDSSKFNSSTMDSTAQIFTFLQEPILFYGQSWQMDISSSRKILVKTDWAVLSWVKLNWM